MVPSTIEDAERRHHASGENIAQKGGISHEGIDDLLDAENGGRILLPLDRAIRLALSRNLILAIERYERSRSILGILQNRGIYDFRITTDLSNRNNNRLTNSNLQEALILEEDAARADFNFSQLTSFGGTLELDYRNAHFNTTDLRADPNPSFTLDLDLTLTQPLLRNFGRAVTERNLIVARTDARIRREDFQIRVEDILQQVIDGYWNLVEANEQLEVARESLKLAEELDTMNQIQVEVGTMAALEVVQSEAGVAARKEDIITFETQVEDAADTLRALIYPESDELWDAEIVPVTDPEVTEHRPIDLREALLTAYELRPDVKRRHLRNETLALDSKVAKNQLLPQLDLQASYGLNALDGDTTGLDAEGNTVEISRGYSDALDQFSGADFKDVTVGVQMSFPLQNRDARARSAAADLAFEQGEMELRNLRLEVKTDVRRAVRAVEAAAQRIETSEVSSRLALRTLEAEQKRYENGLSTSFEVLRIQEDLSEARRRQVSATLAYRRAEAAFFRSIGQLLERHSVRLEDEDEDL